MDYITRKAHEIYSLAHNGGTPDAEHIALYRIYAVLCLAKGEATTNEDVHDAWSAWTAATFPEHRSLKPYKALSPETQAYDTAYARAIHLASANTVATVLDDPENNRALRHGIGHLLAFEAHLLPEDQKRRLGSILHALGDGS